MKSEKEKMVVSEWFKANDKELLKLRDVARCANFEYNTSLPAEVKRRKEIIKNLFDEVKGKFFIEAPFRCDYGFNISIGKNFYANYNFVVLDSAKVTIGDNVKIGPNVAIYTVNHPLNHKERNKHLELAKPVEIGDNVWLGGNVVILGGVKIGKNSVIGAGSVVTKDIPENVLALGNPCRIVKKV